MSAMARRGQKTQMSGKSTKGTIPPGLTLRYTLQGHKDFISRIAWSPDGQSLASVSFDRTIKLWDTDGGELRQTLEGHTLNIHSVAWSPNGRLPPDTTILLGVFVTFIGRGVVNLFPLR